MHARASHRDLDKHTHYYDNQDKQYAAYEYVKSWITTFFASESTGASVPADTVGAQDAVIAFSANSKWFFFGAWKACIWIETL